MLIGRSSSHHFDTSSGNFFGLSFRARSASTVGKTIELKANVGSFGRRIGERYGAVEGGARLLGPAELLEECATRAMEIEIAPELGRKRLDHRQRISGTPHFGNRNR